MKLTDNTPAEGAGPFLFRAGELAPGESFRVDLRNVERGGKKRALRQYVPFDVVTVSNSAPDTPVLATYNGQYESNVLANTVESFSRQGVSEVTVTNVSGTNTIDDGDVTVEVVKEPYGADDRALEKSRQGPITNVVEGVTGVSPTDLLGGNR